MVSLPAPLPAAIAASLTAMENRGLAARSKSTGSAFLRDDDVNDMAAARDPRRNALKGDFVVGSMYEDETVSSP